VISRLLLLSKNSYLYGKIEDYKQLVKFRLNLFVVFSAIASYVIVASWEVAWQSLVLLGVGGFLITGAANALNEVLEKDFDKLMRRTSDRPLPSGRMSVSEAVLAAGLMFVLGIFILTLFNPLAAVLGSLAVITYAFIYTPSKRVGPVAVTLGAIPGALPVLIGAVAYQGTLTPLALLLFGIQFMWQFPHFWSIGWLGFDDYNKAGYKLVPSVNEKPDRSIGNQSMIYTLMLLPFLSLGAYYGIITWISFALLSIITIFYSWFGFRLYKEATNLAARRLMFSSFFYLPLALGILLMFG
jgi:protoheme IX farnesyltransferase